MPFESQERTITAVRRLRGCAAVVWIEHPGGHEIPPGAVETIIRFFREAVTATNDTATGPPTPRPGM